ncbi:hypothetical protein ABE10_01445, partial [Bacillus toyonensis]|nr:hypothetical protein [Bacillus toyonensis]
HPCIKALADAVDPFQPSFGAHRPAKGVGLVGGAVPERRGHLDELFLEHGDAEGSLQDRLQERMRVGHVLLPELAADERMDGATLDGPRTDERDLDGELIELPRT